MIGLDKDGRRLWLLGKNGALEGRRFDVKGPVYRIGSDVHNDLVLPYSSDAKASAFHAEIHAVDDGFELVCVSKGMLLNGKAVSKAMIQDGDLISFGPGGPRLSVLCEPLLVPGIADHVELPETKVSRALKKKGHDTMIAEAVAMVREARGSHHSGQTTLIMRDLVLQALHKSKRKHRAWIGLLLGALVVVTLGAISMIASVRLEKENLDGHIAQLEQELVEVDDPKRVDELLLELEEYERKARKLQRTMLYELGARDAEHDFVEAEIRVLLEIFGAERYVVPVEFVEQVRVYLQRYQSRDRRHVERLLNEYGEQMAIVRNILAQYNLPPDLAYMILVESAFLEDSRSHAGAAGIWQFMPPTARSYGLVVDATVDERFDFEKSTHAAARYLRDLILEFGSGNSVMLALAAYNTGPTRVRREVRKIEDPIRQRNFWYLYRKHALPKETREYVPKIFAALIIGRHPARFGFTPSIAI